MYKMITKIIVSVILLLNMIIVQSTTTTSTTNLEQLMLKNNQLKELNMKLKQLVHDKVGSMKIVNRLANSPSFLEMEELSPSSAKSNNNVGSAGAGEKTPKKKCVEIDDMAGVGEAENNFCLAPDMCRETLYSCKRNCINRCWVDKYGKNGAPPGFGDIDQTRLSVINQRVKQMLQQVNIDLDCTPCTGNKESRPAPTAFKPKPKIVQAKPQRKMQVPKGGDAEGDVKIGFIEEKEHKNNNDDNNSNNSSTILPEPTYGPKYIVISTNHRLDPHELKKQQLEKETAENKTHLENLKSLMLEDDKIKCKNCAGNTNKLLNDNKNTN